MELPDLVRALLSFDALAARQWVADSLREGLVWASIPAPTELDPVGLWVAAGVAELLAGRAGQAPPSWVLTDPLVLHLAEIGRDVGLFAGHDDEHTSDFARVSPH